MHAVPSNLLKLELRMGVSHLVHVAMDPRSFGRAANAFTVTLSLQPQFCYSSYCILCNEVYTRDLTQTHPQVRSNSSPHGDVVIMTKDRIREWTISLPYGSLLVPSK